MSAPAPVLLADPRPIVVSDGPDHVLAGGRCVACGHALLRRFPRCTRCHGEVEDAHFGPGGAVWAVTVVHVPSHRGEEVPYVLAYVDLDEGPRILLRVVDGLDGEVGDRVVLAPPSPGGNPIGRLAP